MPPQKIIVAICILVATWILATFTIGDAIDSDNSIMIGFAVALLAAATVFAFDPIQPSKSFTGLGLIICGTVCIVTAISLQFYLASITAEQSQGMMEMLRDTIDAQNRANFNVDAKYPGSIQAISYLAALMGIWLATIGALFAVAPAAVTSSTANPNNLSQPQSSDVTHG